MYKFRVAQAALVSILLAVPVAAAPERQVDVLQTTQGPLRITPIFHASVMFEFAGKVFFVDPGRGNYEGLPQADVILVTHTHDDHLDKAMIDKLRKPSATIGGTPAVLEAINCKECATVVIKNGEKKSIAGIEVEGFPMYNLAKDGREARHPLGAGGGFILTFGGVRVFLSGDTDCTPEIKALKNIDVAFVLSIGSATETSKCVSEFRPKIFYPYHHRAQKSQDFVDGLKATPQTEVRLRKMEAEP